MGWVILGVFVLGVGTIFRKARKRSRGSGIGNGPISTDSSVNYANVQNQANGAQFRDGSIN
ncbi:MAG: hypothetical protein QOH37_1775 [Nocardioidaceae bacterium]|jgi:hypothetical protein|nr:hypothetical protein [Nocardioidaceae bacterium]